MHVKQRSNAWELSPQPQTALILSGFSDLNQTKSNLVNFVLKISYMVTGGTNFTNFPKSCFITRRETIQAENNKSTITWSPTIYFMTMDLHL